VTCTGKNATSAIGVLVSAFCLSTPACMSRKDTRGPEAIDAAVVDGEDFRSIYAESLKNIEEGEVIFGRIVGLDKDGVLQIEPIREIDSLRTNHQKHKKMEIPVGGDVAVDGIAGDCLEFQTTIIPPATGQ